MAWLSADACGSVRLSRTEYDSKSAWSIKVGLLRMSFGGLLETDEAKDDLRSSLYRLSTRRQAPTSELPGMPSRSTLLQCRHFLR